MKTAYFVVGPESSGTRMLTKLLIANGCYGQAGDEQAMDSNFVKVLETPKIVFRRSFPHGGIWPDLDSRFDLVREFGYQIILIKMIRDINAIAQSQVIRYHVSTIPEALEHVRKAYSEIQNAEYYTGVTAYHCVYESMTTNSVAALRFLELIGFNAPLSLIPMTNENEKYFKGE